MDSGLNATVCGTIYGMLYESLDGTFGTQCIFQIVVSVELYGEMCVYEALLGLGRRPGGREAEATDFILWPKPITHLIPFVLHSQASDRSPM